MTKLTFNANPLVIKAYEYLEDTKDKLKDASTSLKNADIPDSFSHKGYLRSVDDKLDVFYRKVIKLRDWLKKSSREYYNCVDDFEAEIDSVEAVVIKSRKD